MSFKTKLGSLMLLWCISAATIAHAQIRSATITGTVTDASGASVPGAQVIITEKETNISTTAVTTEAGVYTAPYLPAGSYTVAVTATGFAPYRQVDIPVST